MATGNVLGVVGCIVLADELSFVLSRDKDLTHTFVIDNEEGRSLSRKLADYDMEAEMIGPDEMHRVSKQDRFSVLIWMNDASMCKERLALRKTVRVAASGMAEFVGLCLCFYGRCHGALSDLDEIEEEVEVPVMILTDTEEAEVDDCFGANMGGQKEYHEALSRNQDTFFLTPGFAEEWYRRYEGVGRKEMIKNICSTFKRDGYTEMMKLDNGLGDHGLIEEELHTLSRRTGIRVINRLCGLSVFENTYSMAKRMLGEMRPRTLTPFTSMSAPRAYRASGIMVHRIGRMV